MSHTSAIKSIKITNMSALEAAVIELNKSGVTCTLLEDATPRAYFSSQKGMGKAEFVLKLEGSPYDVGFYKQEDGSYEPRTDFWAGAVERVLGGRATTAERTEQAKLGKLFQHYGIAAAMQVARKAGQMVQKTVKADGSIQLIVTGNM